MVRVSIYGSRYDRLTENASRSRHKFTDRVRNFFDDASPAEPTEINFVFLTQAEISLAGKEDFLVEVKGLGADGDLSERVAENVAQFAADNFSYHDCDNHDGWDIPRTALCVVDRINQEPISFSTAKKRAELVTV